MGASSEHMKSYMRSSNTPDGMGRRWMVGGETMGAVQKAQQMVRRCGAVGAVALLLLLLLVSLLLLLLLLLLVSLLLLLLLLPLVPEALLLLLLLL
jgi:hypothetical protein